MKLTQSVLFSLVLVFTTLFTACDNDNDYDPIDQDQLAGFMAVNTVTDQEAVSVALSGNYVGPPLQFRNYTGGYVSIFPGERSTDTFGAYSGLNLASELYTYKKEKYYSLFVIGTRDNYKNVIVEDSLNELQADDNSAYVRYINAIPAPVFIPYEEQADKEVMPASSFTIEFSDGDDVVLSENAVYGEVSDFEKIQQGELDVKISRGESTAAERTITFEKNKVYTILLVGNPNSENEAKEVQIRYIENGMLIKDDADTDAQKLD